MFILVSLTAVSAVDTNQTDDIVQTDSDTVTQDILSDGNDVSSDFSTLHDDINNAQDNTFILEKNYTYSSENDSDYNEGIKIEKTNFVIDGQGFTIDASNNARIFHIINSTLTLKNINFINGYSDLGGAINCNNSNLTIIACNFSGNVVYNDDSNGGAVAFYGDKLTIEDSKFINNTAKCDGGALYFKANNAIIARSNFTNNKAYYNGAVYMNGIQGTVDQCIFINNTATNSSGALGWVKKENGTISNSKFINNSAPLGGAIYVNEGNNFTIVNSVFIKNNATHGGAIYLGEADGTIEYSQFINNTAVFGGAIYSENGNLTVKCSNFTNNSAGEGGAIYFWRGDNKVSNCNFAGNSAKLGGAIYGDNVLYVENSQFSENDAYQDGGAIYSISNLTVVGCQFNNNYAGFSAGAIASPENIKVINSNFTSNKAELLAGAIRVNNTIGIDNCIFVNNTAGSTAGAVLVFYDLKVTNSTFTDNSAERGGAIAVITANISDSNFTSNKADEAGAIFAAGNVTINNCGFEENAAESEGGAISFRPEIDNTTLSINRSTFTKNTALSGGALAITENTTITNSNFINNTAEDGSDNIVTYDDANLTLENVSPDNLTALAYIDLTAGASFVKYGNPVEIKVAVTKDSIFISEGSVFVVFNNETYSADVVNGSATIKVPNVDAGYYTDVKVTYNGNGKYTNSFDTVSFYVSQLKTNVTAAAKTYVINYGGKYSVTLKDENGTALAGKTLTLTINGKEYKATSNANGVATFSLTKAILKSAGTKDVTLKFAGDTNYVGSNATVKITVNKEKTKILKAKKTYKFKKSKKTKNIKVTLKNSKNKVMKKVKVTIKLSGKKIKGKKTVTAKTNNKGVVTFKLGKKLTKKTKVKYTITYNGNSYYNKVTKKGTIKIK